MTRHDVVESRIVRYANRIMVAAGEAPAIDSFEDAARYVLQTDTVLNALEEYMECSIPGACKGARSMEERKQNLAAVLSFLQDRVLHMSMKHISAARILQGSAKDISNLIECVGSLISLEWHQGEAPSTQYVSLRKVSDAKANPLMDIPRNPPDQNSNWMPRLPHVLGSLHKLDPEEMWPEPPWPHYSPTVTLVEDSNDAVEEAAASSYAHHRTGLCEEVQQQQPCQGPSSVEKQALVSPTTDRPGKLSRSIRRRRSGVPSSEMMEKLPCSKPWLPSGKSGVGLVSKCVDVNNDDSTGHVVNTLDLKKKKKSQNDFASGSTQNSRSGRLTVTQRAVNRSDRVMEVMMGDLENLKLELRALQTANKENGTSDNQQTIDTQALRAGVQKLDIRVHQLDKAQGQLRKAWHAP